MVEPATAAHAAGTFRPGTRADWPYSWEARSRTQAAGRPGPEHGR